ncbi:B-cell receptor CD22-like [Notolabrus celidotus]|uniref:B-cell receptor CD22-like n=1 Tax=Notolabrus celidotus TaxID=1203425 RepID=UPI00148F8539|nr:B-cell receptor CD22-like [Notolabrus celidotus]
MILIILVALPGVWSGSWSVVSKDQCALKGTSVLIQCEYDYPFAHIVTKVEWNKRLQVSGQTRLVPLYQIHSAPGHFRYVGDKWSDCSLRIDNVQYSDEGLYFFHFKTTLNVWRSKNPASLTVTELTAVVHPSTVTEGDKVTLTYVSDCLTPVDVVWFRDGQRVSEQVFQARREDAGRYHCTFLGQDTARSTSVTLNVWYSPRKVMLSVRSSSEVVVKGSSVTFSCSSEANPPVTQSGYSLYKDGHYIGTGDTYTIADVQPSHSGLYHCQAWNNISRTGVNFLKSTEVHLDVQYPPVNIIVSMNPPHVMEGSSVNLTCSSSANPAVENYTWFRRITNSCSSSSSLLQVGSGQVLSLLSVEESHTGLYLCQARNTLGGNNSTEVLLTIRGELHGDQSILVLAGVGVFLLVTLLFAAMLFW